MNDQANRSIIFKYAVRISSQAGCRGAARPHPQNRRGEEAPQEIEQNAQGRAPKDDGHAQKIYQRTNRPVHQHPNIANTIDQ